MDKLQCQRRMKYGKGREAEGKGGAGAGRQVLGLVLAEDNLGVTHPVGQ